MSTDPKNSPTPHSSSLQNNGTHADPIRGAERESPRPIAPSNRYQNLLECIREEFEVLISNESIQRIRDQYTERMERILDQVRNLERLVTDLERKHKLAKEQYLSEISMLHANHIPNHTLPMESPTRPLDVNPFELF
eukprot:TRINITY_DN63869_c0_g1_i1.p1 TRINITY_DN63869_c0_g1~~TRINITY_DN63869_c0_g1_i1.p1  ORF type:complete len:137 (-),score=12.97 TRINITY_DN63869_c0_g1_i1:367-777(-)